MSLTLRGRPASRPECPPGADCAHRGRRAEPDGGPSRPMRDQRRHDMREMLTPHRVRAAALALTAAAAVTLTGCGTKTQAEQPASPPIKLDAFQQRAPAVARQT